MIRTCYGLAIRSSQALASPLEPLYRPPELLQEFLRLAFDKPDGVLRFARRLGVFGREYQDFGTEDLPERPVGEWPESWCSAFESEGFARTTIDAHAFLDSGRESWPVSAYRRDNVVVPTASIESLDNWFQWQSWMRAVLSISMKLHGSVELGDTHDWVRLAELIPGYDAERLDIEWKDQRHGELSFRSAVNLNWNPKGKLSYQQQRAYQREFIVQFVSSWLSLAGAGLTLWWPDEGISVREGGGGLFGALMIGLMHAIAGSERIYFCSGCKELYVRSQKRPKPGQRNWCPNCQLEKRDQNQAAKDYRDRKRLGGAE